jgi:GR25 family glycosyltransferase involved in LPS biosynthesis
MPAFYINLDRRLDRRTQFEEECVRMGIDVERFPAVTHAVPALGCTMSHLAVLKEARQRGYESVCIFEDDFEFLISKEEYATLLTNLPENFDVVMLGWYLYQTAPYNEHFGKVLDATTASGYIVHSRFYDRLIANLEEAVTLFQRNIHTYDVVSKYINDQYWRRLQPTANWFYALKRTGKQRGSFSDLVGSYVTYDY